MGGIIAIVISCLFVSNIILSSFLGICPFLGISKKPSNAIGMGFALIFVVTMSAIICYCIERFILQPLGLDYLQLFMVSSAADIHLTWCKLFFRFPF